MKKTIIATFSLALVFAIFFLLKQKNATETPNQNTNKGTEDLFVLAETEHDFGVIPQSGGIVEYSFPFTYNGAEMLTVLGVQTSCGCTTAEIDTKTLTKGTMGIVTVKFDPNLHAEPEGRFYKTISLLTSPSVTPAPSLKIWAEIDLDLGPEFYTQGFHEGKSLLEQENLSPEKDYRTIRAATLKEALEDKHFFLIDVHVPEQEHIEGTDAIIAYDQIQDHLSELPQDKNEKIVLYCRSGSMSQQAAQTLAELGYTDVSHLDGGIQAFNSLK